MEEIANSSLIGEILIGAVGLIVAFILNSLKGMVEKTSYEDKAKQFVITAVTEFIRSMETEAQQSLKDGKFSKDEWEKLKYHIKNYVIAFGRNQGVNIYSHLLAPVVDSYIEKVLGKLGITPEGSKIVDLKGILK